jgi:tight adherence protein C
MEPLLVVYILSFAGAGLLIYSFFGSQLSSEELHLPADLKGGIMRRQAGRINIFGLAGTLIEKGNIPLEDIKKKLVAAGKPMNPGQFLAFVLFLMVALPAVTIVVLKPNDPVVLVLPLIVGIAYPYMWLNGKVKARHAVILRELPHVIDLLNICVGAGLDFMVAVTRVTQGFRESPLIEELKNMLKEIQMGSSRRVALKNLAFRISSPEISSFVRTLLQADKMGTPIAEALKMQAEEVRFRRFQRGEEMGLKAPIKLLFPLLVFILPVVMIIVAGPILIQFTRGGFVKY